MRSFAFLLLFFFGFIIGVTAQACTDAESGSIVVDPPLPPAGGNYPPGTVVNMCFTLNEFDTPSANWLHSIIPQFGDGFDVSTLTPVSIPTSCIGASGAWGWYETWTGCTSSNVFGPGFAFDSDGGVACGGTPLDGDPGNNFGDGGTLCPNREFCWSIETAAASVGCNGESYRTEVYVYADTDTGSWTSPACGDDDPLCWPEIEEAMAEVDNPCPGSPFTLTGSFTSQVNCGIVVEWTGPNGFSSNDLVTTATEEGEYTLNVNPNGCSSFSVSVTASYDNSTPTLTPGPSTVFCFGETVTLTGGGATTYRFFSPTGVEYNTNPVTFTADPSVAGIWTMIATSPPNCSETLLTEVIVLPEIVPSGEATPQPVCIGEEILLRGAGGQPGNTYTWGGDAPPSTDNPHIFTTSAAGNFVATLTITDAEGCTETIDVPYSVNPNPDIDIVANPMMSCEGDPVTITASGGGTYEWSPGGESTAQIMVSPTTTTTYTVTVTSPNGCIAEEDISVDVQPLLDMAAITCIEVDASTITWEWDPVPGADYYEVYIDAFLVEANWTGLSYTLTDLDPLTTRTITIIAFSNNNPNCPGQASLLECTSPDCNPVSFFLETDLEQCYNPANGRIDLSIGAFGDDVNEGSVVWTGPGFSTPTPRPAQWTPPGPGTWTLTATFTLFSGACPYSEDFTFTINETADSRIAGPATACETDFVTVQLQGAANNDAVYSWDFDGAIVISGSGQGPYTLAFPSSGTYAINLSTELNGCTSTDEHIIIVDRELAVPQLICQFIENDQVTFAWNDVPGATAYQVDVLTGQSGVQSGNTYDVTGLTAGEDVTITVTAIGDGACGNSVSLEQTCTARQCPDVDVVISNQPQSFCATGNNPTVDLSLVVSNNAVPPSDTVWFGAGVNDNTFDPNQAGVGVHTVTATVIVDECPFEASIEFTVFELPTAAFSATDTICINSAATILYTGTADPSLSTFSWDFEGGTIVSGTGAGPYEVTWPSLGTHIVTLMVQDENNCSSLVDTQSVEVVDQTPAPVINCVGTALDEVVFEWVIDPNARDYQVVHISGPTGMQVGNTYVVSGINELDIVEIEVTAIVDGACGNSAPTRMMCSPRVCDSLNVNIDSSIETQFCQDGTGSFAILTATVDGGTATGTYTWSGPGVSNDTFFVDAASIGDNEVTVVYEEAGCFYQDMLTLTVLELPNANFNFDLSEVCTDSSVVLTSEVAMPPNSTYTWDFDGGVAVPGTGAGPHSITWDTPGSKTVTLSLVVDGCPMSTTQTIDVIEPLAAPVPFCDGNTLNTATVSWSPVGSNQGYAISVNGAPDTIVNILTFTVRGLLPDSMATIAIRALGDAPCNDGPAAVISCSSAPCPTLNADFSANPASICLVDGTDLSITLDATISGGLGNGSMSFSGPGVTNGVFDPVVAGAGIHTITMDYEEDGPCSLQEQFNIQVFNELDASFTISSDLLCRDESTIITFTGYAPDDATFIWEFDGADILSGSGAGPYELSWSNVGSHEINLSITAAGDCSATAEPQIIVVETPLDLLNITCGDSFLQAVTFDWEQIANATAYEVSYNGVVDTTTAFSYRINDLDPNETVSATIRPLGPMPCGDGEVVTMSCSSLPCPDITVDIQTPEQIFCLIDLPEPIELSAIMSGGDATGSFVWSGAGVVGDNGVYSFDPEIAGVGDHIITVVYTETGNCTGTSEFTLTVNDGPFAALNIENGTICSEEVINISYVGEDLNTAEFTWVFDNATVVDLGNQSFDLSWTAPGDHEVILQVELNGCSEEVKATIEVIAPLETPQPVCDTVGLTNIVYSWPTVVGATGYRISIDNQPTFDQTDTLYTVTDLGESETASISVIAIGNAPCGDSDAGTVSCTTIPCPDVVLELNTSQTEFCTANNDAPVEVTYTATGGFGGGGAILSGAGVISNPDGTYAFDPSGLAPGAYELTLDYTEMICDYSTTITMNIYATPVVNINTSTTELCSSSSTRVSFNGSAGSTAVFDWDFDGADVNPLGNETYELSWNSTGTYTVSLNVEQNGCSAASTVTIEVVEPPLSGVQSQFAAVCAGSGDIIQLAELLTGADSGGTWSPGIGSPAIVEVSTGNLNTANLAAGNYEYIYTVGGGFCDDAATAVTITVQPAPVANAGQDQVLTCAMGMVTLDGNASTGGSSLTYLWTGPDGRPIPVDATSAMVDVAIPGTYTLTVTSDIGCSDVDQVVVTADTEVPVAEIELNDISCFSEMDGTILVNNVQGGRAPYNYSLNGGSPSNISFFTGLDAGEYVVRVTDANGCFSEVILDISRPDQLSVSIELQDDDNDYNEGDEVVAVANIQGGTVINTIVWQPDSLNLGGESQSNIITFIADETRTISVTVTDENGCTATDRQTILVRKERSVYIPNGFSPNGDNVNDIFFIGADQNKVDEVESFIVFNRWGEAVFENYDFQPNDPVEGWDGTHRKEVLNSAVFVYAARVRFNNGDVVVYKGDVTLLR